MQKIFKYIIITLMGYVVCNLIKNTSKEYHEDQKNQEKIGLVINNDIQSINEKQPDKIMEVVRYIWIAICIIITTIVTVNYNNFLSYIIYHQEEFWIPFKTTVYICFVFSLILYIIFAIYENKIKSKIIRIIAWNCYFFCGAISPPFLIIFFPVTTIITG